MLETFKETFYEIIEFPYKFAIGSLLHTFWFLIIPELFVLGYIDRRMRSKNYGINELPKWNNWKNLLYRGTLFFSIILIYSFPGLLIFLLSGKGTNISNSGVSFNPLNTLGIIVFMVLSFLLVGALASYIKRESIIDAFNIREIIYTMVAYPKEYIITYIILLLSPFTIILYAIPILGLFLFGFIDFYILLSLFTNIAKMGGAYVEESKGFQTQEEYYY